MDTKGNGLDYLKEKEEIPQELKFIVEQQCAIEDKLNKPFEIKDRFKDGLVFQEGGVLKVSKEQVMWQAKCLLCDEPTIVMSSSLGIVVCDSCKELWRKLKENEKCELKK